MAASLHPPALQAHEPDQIRNFRGPLTCRAVGYLNSIASTRALQSMPWARDPASTTKRCPPLRHVTTSGQRWKLSCSADTCKNAPLLGYLSTYFHPNPPKGDDDAFFGAQS